MAPFALTIFTGAFLLFQVQPLIGKYILPWFGGSPGVWTTCMLFFQIVLLGGYAYAHFLTERFKPRQQAVIHGVLLLAALLLLPIAPSVAWKPAAALENPTWRILLLLLATIGLPYFVLSTTGPLMQRWFNGLHPGASPYRLYALSNVGSLLALISYPFVFEPMLTRQMQSWLWSGGMVLFAAAAGYCAWQLHRSSAPASAAATDAPPAGPPPPLPGWGTRLLWLVLPAVAVVLLLATTNKLCQDVAVIPFLWVLPLSLYLLTFILCFDHPRWYSRLVFGSLTLLGLGGLQAMIYFGLKLANHGTFPGWTNSLPKWMPGLGGIWAALHFGHDVPLWVQVTLYAGLLFVGCMACHGELAALKPHPRHLTHYFLRISAGGALGGLFVAVGAPHLFTDYYEFHWGWFVCAILVAAFLYHAPLLKRIPWLGYLVRVGLVALVMVTGSLLWRDVEHAKRDALLVRRNFYGSMTVFEYDKDQPETHYYLLQHGKITHGLQLADPAFRFMPTSYYCENSGIGVALKHFPRQTARRLGVVGLGTGTMASHGRTGDYVRIYEINPAVKDLAQTQFTYLKECPATVEVAMGDARLSMENEIQQKNSQQFDVLVLDAFSSDAIPVHLLTKESFDLYRQQLKPDGILAVHISNRYLDLEPVVGMLADEFKWRAWVVNDEEEPEWYIYTSTWVLVTNNEEFLKVPAVAAAGRDWKKPARPLRLWTDDYTALFEVLN
jgi:hypothetical protein